MHGCFHDDSLYSSKVYFMGSHIHQPIEAIDMIPAAGGTL